MKTYEIKLDLLGNPPAAQLPKSPLRISFPRPRATRLYLISEEALTLGTELDELTTPSEIFFEGEDYFDMGGTALTVERDNAGSLLLQIRYPTGNLRHEIYETHLLPLGNEMNFSVRNHESTMGDIYNEFSEGFSISFRLKEN